MGGVLESPEMATIMAASIAQVAEEVVRPCCRGEIEFARGAWVPPNSGLVTSLVGISRGEKVLVCSS